MEKHANSDDSLSSSPIELPLPPLPGQGSGNNGSSKLSDAASKVPAEFDFGPSDDTSSRRNSAPRRTPSPPLPSLTSQDQTLSETWHDDSTPVASKRGQPENANDTFYTAQWGSPYDLPLPKRTRFATDESPLRPTRRRASSPIEIEIDEEADPRFDLTLTRTNVESGTGRFRGRRTEDWLKAHIAHRRRGEKKNWWSDEGESNGEDDDEEEEDNQFEDGAKKEVGNKADSQSRSTPSNRGKKRRGRKSEFNDTWLALRDEDRSRSRSQDDGRGKSAFDTLRLPHRRLISSSRFHRSAPSDATLTQAQWNEILAVEEAEDDEDEDEEEQDDLPDINMLAALSQGMQGIVPGRSSRHTSKDLSNGNSDKPLPPAPLDRTTSESPVGATRPSPDPSKKSGASSGFSRPKKKVPWRGKTCVIALPLEDGKDENGVRKTYLTTAQVSDRLKKWEKEGYSTQGFDLSDTYDNSYSAVRGQSRHIYPDPTEWRKEVKSREYHVKVPNRAHWDDYVRELQEEKLRKLGVLKERPDDSARQSPALSQVQMGGPASSQNSRAPTAAAMSPAMGSSVNGFRGPFGDATFSPASFASPDGIQSRQSMISPVNPVAGFHAPKQSIAFLPGQGFVNLGFPQPQPTPPPALTGQNLLTSQNLLGSQPASRGVSPAIMDLHNRRMSILTTPNPAALQQILNQGVDSAQLRQQQQQLQQAMMQGRQFNAPPSSRPERQQTPVNRPDDMNGPAIYSQPSHIASPMPQGHKHNVSESLQREIDEAEYHLEASIRKQLEDNEEQVDKRNNGKKQQQQRGETPDVDSGNGRLNARNDPKVEKIEADLQTSASSASSPTPNSAALSRSSSNANSASGSRPGHARKASTSKLRANAAEFVFDPTKSFKPSGMFNFGQVASPPRSQPFGSPFTPMSPKQQQAVGFQPSVPAPFQFGKRRTPGHSKSSSISSNLNVAAREFVPGQSTKAIIPETGFSFSAALPGTRSNAQPSTPRRSAANSISSVVPSESGSAERPAPRVFGNFDFSEMVKVQRTNKAVPIIKPETPPEKADEAAETPSGVDRLENKREKTQQGKADGDDVPQFAVPRPEPAPQEQMRIAQQQVKAATPEPPTLRSTHTPPPGVAVPDVATDEQPKQDEAKDDDLAKPAEKEPVLAEEPAAEQPQELGLPPPTFVLPSQPAATEKKKEQPAEFPVAPSSEQPAELKVEQPAEKAIEKAKVLEEQPAKSPYELRMPKVDTEIPPQPAQEIVDWAETPLEGPFSRQNLDKAFAADRSRQESIVEEPAAEAQAEAEAKEVIRRPSPRNAAVPIVKPEDSKPVEQPVQPVQPETIEEPKKVPTPKPGSAAIPIVKPEEPKDEVKQEQEPHREPTPKAPTPKPASAAIPIVNPAELETKESEEEEIPKAPTPKAPTPKPVSAAIPIVKPEEPKKEVEQPVVSKAPTPEPASAAIPIVKPEEVKPVEAPVKVPTPKPVSFAIPIVKPEEPAKTPSPQPRSAAIPIVKPDETKSAQEAPKKAEPFVFQQPARIPEPEHLSKKRRSSPEEKPATFNPAAFNPAASAFNPGASAFLPSTVATQFTFTAPEPATPEQEWPEVQRQRIIKAPPKLGLQGRKIAGATKGGLVAAGGGLLGTSRWATAGQESTPSPKPKAQAHDVPEQEPTRPVLDTRSSRDRSPHRGRKSLVREHSPPAPAYQPSQLRARSPSPDIGDTRKGFTFSAFGERLAAARQNSPPREPSPPVRGRGKKGSATNALSRSPSPAYNRGFNFSTYRDHQFAAPKSPPLPPRSPSLAYSPPPGTPTPPIPERSPSRPAGQLRAQPATGPEPMPEPMPEPVKRQPSLPRPNSNLRTISPQQFARTPSPALLQPQPLNGDSRARENNNYLQASPTYQEIDEVIKQLNNGSDSERGVERTPLEQSRAESQIRSKGPSPERLISLSPVQDVVVRSSVNPSQQEPTSDPNNLVKPFQYLPPEHEFGSSGSAVAELVQRNARFSPSFKPSRRDDEFSPSRKMGHIAHRESVSDWNDVLSSSDEAKFHARTRFFDHKVNDEIGEVIQARLRPLEQGLALLNKSLEQIQSERQSIPRAGRSRSADLPSDADDEDDEQPRGLSPVKDRKFDKLKSAVVEAVSQHQKAANPDIEHMMLALADMKTQMAQQAANAPVAKDLDMTIEESISRHLTKANAAIAAQDAAADDKLKVQLANFEGLLKAAEQRVEDEQKARYMAESAVQANQKLLRAAQDEAAQFQKTAEETEGSLKTFLDAQQESKQRMAMLEEAEEAMQNKVLQLSSKNEALEDTLEEYRMAHNDMKKEIEAQRAEKSKMNDDWNADIDAGRAENDELQTTIEKLRGELEEGLQSRHSLREKFDKLREDMAEAVKNVTRDQANWRQKEEEHNAKQELQSARLEAEARTRERLELEIDRLEKQEKEGMRARYLNEQIRSENLHLGSLVNELRGKCHEYQDVAAAAKRDVEDVKLRARTEIERMNKFMNSEAESSRSQANIARQELQAVIINLEKKLEFAQQESATAKSRFNEMIDEVNDSKERSLREATELRDASLQESYRFHERQLEDVRQVHHEAMSAAADEHRRALEEMQERHQREIEELRVEHGRAMRYANDDHKHLMDSVLDDKSNKEKILNDRLSLADDKIAHYNERIRHLEERVEIASSAAKAAAEAAAKATKKEPLKTPRTSMASVSRPSMSFAAGSYVPDKISPQALRESIAVLQEQLHQRESTIERLETELEPLRDLPEKVKEKDLEINFVRELLDVRMDDLQDIIRTLSQPQGFSRERVRDAVIRLRANLQMEQQEKERQLAYARDPTSAPPPAPSLTLSGLRDMASSPRNVGLAAAAAWGNWRRGVSQPLSSLAEMSAAPSVSGGDAGGVSGSGNNRGAEATPSRSSPSSFLSGLLTPPASNVRSLNPTPAAGTRVNAMGQRRTSTASSTRGGRSLHSFTSAKHPHHSQRPSLARAGASEERHAMLSELPQPDTPPGLLNKNNYEQDAEDGEYSLERYINEREEDEHENETVIEEEGDSFEDDGRYAPETGHEAVGVVEEPFGPVIGA